MNKVNAGKVTDECGAGYWELSYLQPVTLCVVEHNLVNALRWTITKADKIVVERTGFWKTLQGNLEKTEVSHRW